MFCFSHYFLNSLNFRSPSTHSMPRWVKRVFLKVLPKLLLMRQPSEQIKIGNYSYTYANILNEKSEYHPTRENSRADSSSNYNKSNYNMNYAGSSDRSLMHARMFSFNSNFSNLKRQLSRSYEVTKVIEGINYVCEHLKKEDLEKMVI